VVDGADESDDEQPETINAAPTAIHPNDLRQAFNATGRS
jgi:hypothetical protein